MRRFDGWLFSAVVLTAGLALAGCPDEDGTGNGTGGDAIDDTGGTTADDTGESTADDTGESTADDTGESTADDTGESTTEDTGESTGDGGSGSGGDDAGGSSDAGDTGQDTYDGGSGGDTDASTPDFVTRNGAGPCPTSAAARVQVGPGNSYTAQIGDSDPNGPPGNVTIEKGQWVNFSWAGGPHTVTGDKSTDFDSSLNDACKEGNTAWFDSGSKNAGLWCVQINKTGTFHYQCTVGGHCESGMWSFIKVE